MSIAEHWLSESRPLPAKSYLRSAFGKPTDVRRNLRSYIQCVMTFMNNNGDSFVMHIVGYQFPGQTVKQDHDSNWLMIRISARIGGKTWTRVEPALLTWEVDSLINWLRQIAGNRDVDNKLEFIEPNLSFCLQRRMDNVDVIRVSFDLEFLPDDHFEENDCSGEFQLNKQNIETAASELETELARFGPR